jgi:hypothetical protein
MRKLLLAVLLLSVSPLRAETIETWSGPWLPWPVEGDLGDFYLSLIPRSAPELPNPLPEMDPGAVVQLEAPLGPGLRESGGDTAVPEPSTAVLLTAGVLAAGWLAARRRN